MEREREREREREKGAGMARYTYNIYLEGERERDSLHSRCRLLCRLYGNFFLGGGKGEENGVRVMGGKCKGRG